MYVTCHLFSCYPTGKHTDTQSLETKTVGSNLAEDDWQNIRLWQKDYIILIADS